MMLVLPHVPEPIKNRVRVLVEPLIPKLPPIVQGNCYQLAKRAVRLGGRHFRYVEGVWYRQFEPDGKMQHAWFTVFGFCVDLFQEVEILENGPETWIHEGILFCSRCRSRPVGLKKFRCEQCTGFAHNYSKDLCAHCEKAPRENGLSRCARCQERRLKLEKSRRMEESLFNINSENFYLGPLWISERRGR